MRLVLLLLTLWGLIGAGEWLITGHFIADPLILLMCGGAGNRQLVGRETDFSTSSVVGWFIGWVAILFISIVNQKEFEPPY
jgi:hypothetical protein